MRRKIREIVNFDLKKRSLAFHVHPSTLHIHDLHPSPPPLLFFLNSSLLTPQKKASMAAATLVSNNVPQLKLHFSSSKNSSHFILRSFRSHGIPRRSSLQRMTISGVFNAQIGKRAENSRRFGYENGKIYRRLDSCLVIPPARGKKPKGLIKFLGGAFIGAVPEVTYR